MKKNQLPIKDHFQIYDLVRTNQAEFAEQRGWVNAAAWAGARLGLPITEYNIKSAAEAVGVKPKFQERRPNPSNTNTLRNFKVECEERITKLEADHTDRITKLENEVRFLRAGSALVERAAK